MIQSNDIFISETCAECGNCLEKNDEYICKDCFDYYILMQKVKRNGLSFKIKE